MASDDSDLAGAPLGAALCPEARGPLLFSASLGPSSDRFQAPAAAQSAVV
jgi:hypothetical protein